MFPIENRYVTYYVTPMTLKEYLDLHGLSLKSFGDLCGLSAPTILRVRDGVNIPSRRTLRAIMDATDGAVSIPDLVTVETPFERATKPSSKANVGD